MRIKCLKKSEYPIVELKQSRAETALIHLMHARDDVHAYREYDREPEMIKSMRQYVTLAVLADEEELQRNIDTGRLRGNLYLARALPLMVEVVDYNIELLSGGAGTSITSADDAKRAADSTIPRWERDCLLARVAYRESLLSWRYAFIKKRETGPSSMMGAIMQMMSTGTIPSQQNYDIDGAVWKILPSQAVFQMWQCPVLFEGTSNHRLEKSQVGMR